MWKLTIEDDQGSKTVVHLVRDEYTIGRAEENAIRLTERNISRRHARLQKTGNNAWQLHDADSYNGCYVNGQRVAQGYPLNQGDLIQFGDYRLVVEDESLTDSGRNDRAQTVPGLPRLSMVTQADRLVQLVGPEPGTEFALSQRRMVVGRGEECDISINHPSVSRVHAEIIPFGDGRYEVRDMQSANGIRVNGVELPQSLLDARDVLELGDVVLKYIPAGELYIPGADDTQARTAMASAPGGFGGLPAPAKVAIGAALVAAVLVLVLVLRGSANQTELAVDTASGERAAKLLGEAKSLLAGGNADAALAKAMQIPADSNLRDSADFKAIHAGWADALFTRAAASEDRAQKRALLDQIARSTSLDSARRQRASDEITALASAEAVDVSALPSDEPEAVPVATRPPMEPARVAAAPAPRAPESAPEPAPVKAAAPTLVRRNPFDSSGASDPAPTAPATGQASAVDLATSGDRSKLVQAKAQLKAKAQSGQATERDLKMLKALCRQLGDASCSN